jgi:hypothetical protein
VGLAGCRSPQLSSGGCQRDEDCGAKADFLCEVQTGECFCRTDDACPAAQFCNPSGYCQDKAGCVTNADCGDTSLICETSTGNCLPRGRCSTDLDCALGEVCDGKTSRCVEGCHDDGDCSVVSCRCGSVACACAGTTPAERAACTVGVCDPNFCSNDTFCRFGELCGAAPDAGTPAACFSDYDPDLRPYCDNCTFGGGLSYCGTGANYCLIDTRHPGNYYCGADCSEGQSCPRGYGCQDVIVVFSQWECTRLSPTCPTNPNLPCTTDADCKHGGSCVIGVGQASGFCAGQCQIEEGDPTGFCSCQVDADCAQESCSAGECSISRHRCVTDQDCRSIRCVDYESGGGCLIGENCAPENGLSCTEVRQ